MLLFNREVKVLVSSTTDVLEITKLRVSFEIKKDDSSKQNELTLQIYNMNSSSRAKVDTKDLKVELSAGYDGVAELIFKGDIIWAVHRKEGPDIITKIQAKDGSIATRETFFTESFTEGTTVKQVLSKVAAGLGLPIKSIPDDIVGSFANGFSASSPVKGILDQLKKSFGFDWSVQDGELQITKTGETVDDIILEINQDTGMIGFPEKLTGDGDKLEGDKEIVPNGVSVKSLLLPKARPGRRIQLDSDIISGDFKILNVGHVGDTHDNSWFTKIEAEVI